ncbi:CIC11C00000003959 [Sungouiella intermedia]|uniref:CIC11C00000003959 n=1 Tax=Sungouiella intermedia TaxID=45354 RepID=A0A1L0BHT8_9ASCO|nr:CIC11C00000003959 [[Candida] intermedia]
MIGVVIDDPINVAANFFVPHEKLAAARLTNGLPVGANSVYLGNLGSHIECIDTEIQDLSTLKLRTFFLDLMLRYLEITFWVEISLSMLPYLDTLLDLLLSLVVVVPAVADVKYWAKLRDYRGSFRLAVGLDKWLSPNFVARYKTLAYDAVVVRNGAFTLNVVQLVARSDSPDILILVDSEVSEVLKEIKYAVASAPLSPHSDMLIDPLQPLTTQMGLEVYETFEKDKVKYSQYEAAIEMAIDDLRQKSTNLRILVVGPGRGPLLQSVLRCSGHEDTIVAVEKNLKCMEVLSSIVKGTNVQLIHGDVRTLEIGEGEGYDLVVSELLGSFGCNEACPEILQHLANSTLIFIPQEYSSYVQPIYTNLKTEHISRPYLAQLNSYFPVGELVEIFHHTRATKLNQKTSFYVESPIRAGGDPPELIGISMEAIGDPTIDYANALHGFFDAQLYGPYHISILPHASPHVKCLSWFPMVFPIKASIGERITMSRCSDEKRMWYEWKVGDIHFNVGGTYSVDL